MAMRHRHCIRCGVRSIEGECLVFHVHFDSRRQANPVFHMRDDLIQAALARRPELSGKIQITTGWDLEGFADRMKTADMFVGFRVPRDNLRAVAPQLKSIHLIGAGVEHLRPFNWVPKGLELTNNRGIHTQKAGEYILMAVLMLNNRVPSLVNAQAQREWRPLFTGQLKGKTLLIVGAGQLGSAGAREVKKVGMHVIGIRRSAKKTRYCDETVGPEHLHEVLPRADIVLITVPSTSQTDGLIGAAEFDRMKPGAGFINFSRAQTVDYKELSARVRDGRLSGAILDVFDPEPLPSESYLWDVPNLLITPHCSSDDAEKYIPMTLDLVFDNVARTLSGAPLLNKVNVKREY